ncbi:MAG: ferrous iron transport protein A [Microbacteriaceae bacterium]
MDDPVLFISTAPLGTRVVVRRRIENGFTDALGYLRSCTATECTVETRRGLKTVPLNAIVAAKQVPPPPPRRAPRNP